MRDNVTMQRSLSLAYTKWSLLTKESHKHTYEYSEYILKIMEYHINKTSDLPVKWLWLIYSEIVYKIITDIKWKTEV